MQQLSGIGFGADAAVMAGYALAANDRLGVFDLVIENTGTSTLYLRVKEHDGVTSPSGFADVLAPISVVAGGRVTRSLSLVSKVIGFFGSGNTTANISTVIANRADRRGAGIDFQIAGRKGWGFDDGVDQKAFLPKWPAVS